MNLKNTLRNLLKIRVPRETAPAGPKPQVGSNIVRGRVRIRLKYPISDEQWQWFIGHAWRTVDMRTDRRHYTCLPDKVLIRLLAADENEREFLHERLIKAIEEKVSSKRSSGNKYHQTNKPKSNIGAQKVVMPKTGH